MGWRSDISAGAPIAAKATFGGRCRSVRGGGAGIRISRRESSHLGGGDKGAAHRSGSRGGCIRYMHDGEPVPKDLLPIVPLKSLMLLLVPRAPLWSALDDPPKRAIRSLPALAGRSMASCSVLRGSVPHPVSLGSGCGVLPRAAPCLVVVDIPGRLPVHPCPSASVYDTLRVSLSSDRARALPSPEFPHWASVRIAYLLRIYTRSIG